MLSLPLSSPSPPSLPPVSLSLSPALLSNSLRLRLALHLGCIIAGSRLIPPPPPVAAVPARVVWERGELNLMRSWASMPAKVASLTGRPRRLSCTHAGEVSGPNRVAACARDVATCAREQGSGSPGARALPPPSVCSSLSLSLSLSLRVTSLSPPQPPLLSLPHTTPHPLSGVKVPPGSCVRAAARAPSFL